VLQPGRVRGPPARLQPDRRARPGHPSRRRFLRF
jgi:hypothetical protein